MLPPSGGSPDSFQARIASVKSQIREVAIARTAVLRSRISHFENWLKGNHQQHFGPTCRITELFQRRDQIYFSLAAGTLRWHLAPPRNHHEVFDVARKVNEIEKQIGYSFKNKLLCVEALKCSGRDHPIYFNGTVHPVPENNRLALLGDRALSMALCEIWFHAGFSPKEYTDMDQNTATRANLAVEGRKMGIHEALLKNVAVTEARRNMVAEAFEAILGAIYVDSNEKLAAVTAAIKRLKLDKHQYLQATKAAQAERHEEQRVADNPG